MGKVKHQNPNIKKSVSMKQKAQAHTKSKAAKQTGRPGTGTGGAKRHRPHKSVRITTPVIKRMNMHGLGYRGSFNNRSSEKGEVEGITDFLNRFVMRLTTKIFKDVASCTHYSDSGVTIQPRHVEYVAKKMGQHTLIPDSTAHRKKKTPTN